MNPIARMILVLLLIGMGGSAPAFAHKLSLSYLQLERSGDRIQGEVRLPYVDLELAVGLDQSLDGEISWGEVRQRLDAVEAYVGARLVVDAGGPCRVKTHTPDSLSKAGEGLLALQLDVSCPDGSQSPRIESLLFSEIDPSSRTLLRFIDNGAVTTRVLLPAQESVAAGTATDAAPASGFATYLVEGLAHLFGGPDHLLFLVLLIVPGVQASVRMKDLVVAVMLPITGFTAGHALTLTAAASDVIQAPAALVESLIALTILLTAIDNVKRFLPGPRTLIAGVFGLVHGLGFAGALGALDLQGWTLALALLGFNLGIEAGQAILALALAPLLFLVRGPVLRLRLLPHGVSAAAGVMALIWIAERTGLVV